MQPCDNVSKPAGITKILVVEDEQLVALDIEAQLSKEGYGVVGPCATADQAMKAIAKDRPDLILMDIRIKGQVDGIEAARRIGAMHDIPVVFLTAHSDPDTLLRVRQTAPFGYLSKPFQPRSVVTTIEIALNRHRLEKGLRKEGEHLSAILGNLTDGVIVADREGTIQFMNQVAEELTGWSISDARNQPVELVLPIRDGVSGFEVDDLVPDVIARQLTNPIPSGMFAASKTNRTFPVEGEITPSPSDVMPGGCMVIFRDISARLSEDSEASNIVFLDSAGQTPNCVLVPATYFKALGAAIPIPEQNSY